jgi:aryl-alcohol dehydrogenase-like predicted oxidoreductase
MKYTTLPHTNVKVSKICLGTMTWGQQNTEVEAHEQMDYAFEKGINFFDTAELYPVPARAATYGLTEKYIGSWFKKTGNREKIILASKIAGPGAYTAHIRKTGFSKQAITDALHGSLNRLQTDYIDLYQLHWPERPINCFGIRDYPYHIKSDWQDNFAEVLETLDAFIKQGKIRHIGLSNESAWGTMRYLEESKLKNLPRPVTIQNAYSLLHRVFEIGHSEISLKEDIGLLPYSPLGYGVLSGKYLHAKPKDSRIALFPNYSRYSSPQSSEAVKKYLFIAEKYGLNLAQMSLAFVNQMPFVTSNIIGATKMGQLKENIESINIDLSGEVIGEINAVHAIIPNPAA